MLARILDRLHGFRLPALAWLLSLPVLGLGFQADDHVYRLARVRGAPAWQMFTLTLEEAAEQREQGWWVWWSSARLRVDFIRPLTSLNHWLEYGLFPSSPWVMLLINTLLYAGCVALAVALYRRVLPDARTATLAGLMYAIDDAHAMTEGWISGRNTLLAGMFSLAALLVHMEARKRRSWQLQLAAGVCVALALGSSEAGLWSFALLFAYALALDEGSWHERTRSLLPAACVTAAWAVYYVASGPHGVPGASYYREVSRPLSALGQGLLDLPVWTMSVFGPSIAMTLLTLPAAVSRLIGLTLSIPPLTWLLPTLPSSRPARFFATASLLCLLPVLFTVPQDRTAFGATFGGFGWMACFIGQVTADSSLFRRFGRGYLLLGHVYLMLLVMLSAERTFEPIENAVQLLAAEMKPVRQVVLLNEPVEVIHNYAINVRSLPPYGERPGSTHALYAGSSPLRVTRVDDRTLDIHVERGWGSSAFERTFCAPEEMPRTGEERRARGLHVKVLASNAAGMPERVRFQFDTPLEDPERIWLRWQPGGPANWQPPAVGQSDNFPALNLFAAVPWGPRKRD
ncbi:MAG TPA: hypothetical protein VJV78_18825 [Polyangiales bacterium]|nr:hypothetical protein [Polyangiales bacterium]